MQACAFALIAAAPTAYMPFNPDALSLVKRAIESDARTTYTCIREWTPFGGKQTVRVRRDQSASGANRVLVVAPMKEQGFTIVDNGRQRVTYNPDRAELTIQDSPLLNLDPKDALRRFRLLEQNYKLTFEADEVLAGRPVARVGLQPLAKDFLYARRYWIDKEKSVLLRVEWSQDGGRRQIVSNTISIDYPKSLPPDTFASRFYVGTPKEIRIQAPQRQKCLSALATAVGFAAINPVEMPFGFLFIGADAIKGRNRTMAALRYTDGAANLTVYQAPASSGSAPWHTRSRMPAIRVDDIWLTIEGDVPTAGTESVAAALKQSTAARESALQERAAAQMGVSAQLVRKLRDMGLGFSEVIASLSAARGKEKVSLECGAALLEGMSISKLAEKMRAKESAMRASVKRFWDMRE